MTEYLDMQEADFVSRCSLSHVFNLYLVGSFANYKNLA